MHYSLVLPGSLLTLADAHVQYWSDKGDVQHNEEAFKEGFERGWDK
jgi:hypothetical protein